MVGMVGVTTARKREAAIRKRAIYVLSVLLMLPILYFASFSPSTDIATTPSSTGVSVGHGKGDYELALSESLGFFDDVTAVDWNLMKSLTKRQRVSNPGSPTGNNSNPASARAWYQNHWDPDFSCRHEVKIGKGDGGKWVCDPHRLRRVKQHPCLVYSVGCSGDFRFEDDFLNFVGAENCEVHTFDPTDYTAWMPKGQKNIHFHAWGLTASYKEERQTFANLTQGDGPNYKTLRETMEILGHQDRTVDVFKIDCELCEWATYLDWVGPNAQVDLRQVLVEVHGAPEVANDFFNEFQQAGYVIFHEEPNVQFSGGVCQEYSFLKLAKSFAAPVL